MIKTFKQFILESLTSDQERRLRELGMPTIDIDRIADATGAQVNDNKLILTTECNMNLDDLGIDSDNFRERISDFYLAITVTVDFDQKKISASGNVSQFDIGLDEMIELEDLDWGSVFPMGEPEELTTDEIIEALEEMMERVAGFDDQTGLIDAAREIVTHALFGKWTDEMFEELTQDQKRRLSELGLAIDVEKIGRGISELSIVDQVVVEGQTLTVLDEIVFNNIDIDFGDLDIDFGDLDIEHAFYGKIELTLDFENSTVKGKGYLSQKDLDLYEDFDLPIRWGEIFQNGDPVDIGVDETVEDLSHFIELAYYMEDSTGFYHTAEEIIQLKVKELTQEEIKFINIKLFSEDDTVLEKKRLKWHDSDAPDAKGKFKELGVQKLADWLIRTRGGNMQKITGSLNQQINFNKRKNPSYAKKMESTREAVKRKLAKKKK